MAQYVIDNRPEEIPFEESGDRVSRIVRNAKNLLMTRMGEIPYDRLRGFDPALYDLPFDEFRAEVPKEVDRIMLWEPRLKVVSAEASMDRDADGLPGKAYIRVIIDITTET